MDNLYAIGAGLVLRFVVDLASDHNLKIAGSLVGLWEGVVLYHFLGKMPRSFDPYVAYGFRLFVDFLFTESLAKMTIVLLWTGLGVLLSDIAPVVWNDSGLRRLYRRTWVRLPRLPSVPKVGIPARRTVQFWDSPPTPSSAASDITDTPTSILPVLPPTSRLHRRSPSPPSIPDRPSLVPRRSLPGRFPGFGSETETNVSGSQLTTTDDSASDSDTATPPHSHIPEIIPDDGLLPAQMASALLDADAVTDSQELTPKGSSIALFPTTEEPFHIIEPEEVQPAIDDVPNIPDDPPASSSHLPIPPISITAVPDNVAPTPVPPMPSVVVSKPEISTPIPDTTVPASDIPPPVPDKLPIVREAHLSAADIPLPPSDDRTLPPPADEWIQVQSGDVPNRRSFAESELTAPESVLAGGRDSLLSRADLFRQEADEADKIRADLANRMKELKANGDVKGAFLLKTDVEEAENTVKKLNERAERRYYHGMNHVYLFCTHTLTVVQCITISWLRLRLMYKS